MLAALLVFSLLVYGLAYLVADAKIFGCPARAFYADPTDVSYIREHCVLPLRQIVMRWGYPLVSQESALAALVSAEAPAITPGKRSIFKLFLTCYFCLGVWCGALIHLALIGLFHLDPSVPLISSYPLLSLTLPGILVGTVLAAVAGAVMCYILDLLVQMLENKVAAQTLVLEAAEEAARLRATEKLDVVLPDNQ